MPWAFTFGQRNTRSWRPISPSLFQVSFAKIIEAYLPLLSPPFTTPSTFWRGKITLSISVSGSAECTGSHCCYLDIYISQNIRLCKGNFEGQRYQFFDLKIKIYHSHFPPIFGGVVKSSSFCTLLMLFQRVEILELQFDAGMWLKWFNLFKIASTVWKSTRFDNFFKK